jgi:hypothetical protein
VSPIPADKIPGRTDNGKRKIMIKMWTKKMGRKKGRAMITSSARKGKYTSDFRPADDSRPLILRCWHISLYAF